MSKTRFSVGYYDLELVCDFNGNEYIIYDNKTVSEKRTNLLTLSSTHQFEVNESDEVATYNVTFQSTFSGLVQYTVNRNNIQVQKGKISSITLGLVRIFFLVIGLCFLMNCLWLSLYIYNMKPLGLTYTSSELTNFYIRMGINFIFGAFFLIFAFLLKRVLLKLPKLIPTVLWLYLGMMLVTFVFVFWNLIQQQIFVDWGIFRRILFIWCIWSILENCQAMSKELKL